jgi:hypothetical protein
MDARPCASVMPSALRYAGLTDAWTVYVPSFMDDGIGGKSHPNSGTDQPAWMPSTWP